MTRRLIGRFTAVVIATTGVACSDGSGSGPAPRLVLSPPWASISAADAATSDTVRARYVTEMGDTLAAGAVTWTSTNANVASVDASGLIHAHAVGAATIRGAAGGDVAAVAISVTDPVLVGAGDIGSCVSDRDAATALLLDSIAGTVMTLGDNDYADGASPPAYGVCFDSTWGRHQPRVIPAPGEDDRRGGSLAGYFAYFGAAAHGPSGYYSFDLGNWHIVVLNATPSVDTAQVTWLRNDLAAQSNLCTAVLAHRPRFSSGNAGSSSGMAAVFQALDDYGVELLLSGNDHDYERFGPQAPDQSADPDSGVVQFVVGTGGRSHGGINVPLEPNSQAQNADTYGVLKLTLHPASYDWRFIPVAGRTFTDFGTRACH
ncbi:MAG TPA: Ig-like domain-containing protein [Gemmatimonadales bacterium]|nr:Ig-like domain-containing protein [Gemmatimonadales bacterium]